MTSQRNATTTHIRGPGELVQAVPYLLGFHPTDSLVLVGLRGTVLIVTARLDLPPAHISRRSVADVVGQTVSALTRGGADALVCALYDSSPCAGPEELRARWGELIDTVAEVSEQNGVALREALLVREDRWWSLMCENAECCPIEGVAFDTATSPFVAAATVEGLVALPDRDALQRLLDPAPARERERLVPRLAQAEEAAMHAIVEGGAPHQQELVVRAIIAAARRAEQPGWREPRATALARFGAALVTLGVRDRIWIAIDDGRVAGTQLWRVLARRLPDPYAAAPYFLFGWASWRSGNGALAGIAAQHALTSDPGYSAAEMLLTALAHGVGPRQVPPLGRP
jgi:hypothetical protein